LACRTLDASACVDAQAGGDVDRAVVTVGAVHGIGVAVGGVAVAVAITVGVDRGERRFVAGGSGMQIGVRIVAVGAILGSRHGLRCVVAAPAVAIGIERAEVAFLPCRSREVVGAVVRAVGSVRDVPFLAFVLGVALLGVAVTVPVAVDAPRGAAVGIGHHGVGVVAVAPLRHAARRDVVAVAVIVGVFHARFGIVE